MSTIGTDTRSLRAERLRAHAPRIAFYAVVAVLCLSGLRTIVAGRAATAARVATPSASAARSDIGVASFAEGFTRAYLSWDRLEPEARERRLGAFLSGSFGVDAGVIPGEGTSQSVLWTAVVAITRTDRRSLVTVAAETSAGDVHLSVPVARDARGALRVAGYPAIVGPPAIDRDTTLDADDEEQVQDEALETVAVRAVTNYITRARRNLAADLAPGARVSLPLRALRVVGTTRVSWAVARRRVAVLLQAQDQSGTAWTLRYELDVRKTDRWYVRSIHVNPTGGS